MKYLGCIFLILIVSCSSAEQTKKARGPEEKLLNLFRLEKKLVEDYQNDYIGYIEYQIVNFERKQNIANDIIKDINTIYDALGEDEKREYQLKWEELFQPIIDEIYQKTRTMLVNQTGRLDQKQMTKIQELYIKMEMMEKAKPAAKLKPRFYTTPE